MNNEEKILSMLETLTHDVADLKDGQKAIRKDIESMKVELKSGVWDEINRLYKRVDKIETHLGIR